MSEPQTPPRISLGAGAVYLNGVPVGNASTVVPDQRPHLTATGFTGGTHRPCETCHRPAAVIVNGKAEQPPGGITLEWEDEARSVLWVTPHESGCAEAARPNDPTGKRVTLPPSTIGAQSFELNGVVMGDRGALRRLAAAYPLSPGERVRGGKYERGARPGGCAPDAGDAR